MFISCCFSQMDLYQLACIHNLLRPQLHCKRCSGKAIASLSHQFKSTCSYNPPPPHQNHTATLDWIEGNHLTTASHTKNTSTYTQEGKTWWLTRQVASNVVNLVGILPWASWSISVWLIHHDFNTAADSFAFFATLFLHVKIHQECQQLPIWQFTYDSDRCFWLCLM